MIWRTAVVAWALGILVPSPLPALAQDPSAAAPDTALARRLDELLTRVYRGENRAGAVVLATRNGESVFRKAYGLADVELNVPMTPEHILAIGSMTKPFTALAILRLAQERRLGLDDEVTRYLPGYPATDRPITIRHLLSHTSGIPDYIPLEEWQARIREDVSPEELLEIFASAPADFPPGEGWKYSNSGYHLLGMILEKVGGSPYEEVLREAVLDPVGARNTVLGSNQDIIPGRARGYEVLRGEMVNPRYMSTTHPWAGGGLLSTVDDLAALDRALAPDGLLHNAMLREHLSPVHLNDGTVSEYALGWFVGDLGGRPIQYHGGGIFGYVGHMIRVPEEGLFVALLTNCTDPNASPSTRAVAERVALLLLGEADPSEDRVAIQLPEEDLRRYVGTYELAPGQVRTVTLVGGKLHFEVGGGRTVEILPESASVFFVHGARGFLEFEFGPNGEATTLVIHTAGGRSIRAAKLSPDRP